MTLPKKPKKRRKARTPGIVKFNDDITREIVFARDKWCVLCGETAGPQPSHFFGKKRYPRLRWELQNVHKMCSGCHSLHHHGGQEYTRWWLGKYGWPTFDHFLEIGNKVMSSAERRAFRESEKERLENLKERNQ